MTYVFLGRDVQACLEVESIIQQTELFRAVKCCPFGFWFFPSFITLTFPVSLSQNTFEREMHIEWKTILAR